MRARYRGRRRTGRVRRDDGGFLLIESMVAIAVVTIVMTALAVLLISVNSATTRQRNAQTASRLAVSALDRARAVGAAGAVSGRDATSSNTQLTTTPATPDFPANAPSVKPWLATMTPAVDSTAHDGDGAGAAVPTVAVHQTFDGSTFSVSYFVGYCWRATSGDAGDCGSTESGTDPIQYVRVVVAVAWPGSSCGSIGCDFVAATLLNGSGDPVFNVNQATAPTLTMNAVPAQYTAPGATVAGITGVSGCASPCAVSSSGGAPPYTFVATGLPAGLTMVTSGLGIGVISGTAPSSPGTTTVTVTVTDAFLNTASTSFPWTIGATPPPTPPTVTAPTTVPAATVGQVTSATARYTCPNGGCSFTVTGAPGGVAVTSSTGTTSGTITLSGKVSGSAGTFRPVVTATDRKGLTGTATFPWTVAYAPLTVTSPGNQSSKRNQSVRLDLSGNASGGSGSVVWSDTGRSGTLPSGLSISSSGLITGTTPSSSATWAVTLQVSDTVTKETVKVSFSWSVSKNG